jgi:hypothetical protein
MNKNEIYTANQPLCLGGQIYMWNRYANVGHMVHMPDAQFTKGGHMSRIDFLAPDGKVQPMIFPLKDRFLTPVNECLLHEQDKTFRKFFGTIRALYAKFYYFKTYEEKLYSLIEVLDGTLFSKPVNLATLNSYLWNWVAEEVGIRNGIEQHYTTKLGFVRPDDPSEWVAMMGAAIGCKLYLGGGTAANAYLKKEHFSNRGMDFISQDYKMKPYRRTKSHINDNAMVSILDPLFIGGPNLVQELVGVPAW